MLGKLFLTFAFSFVFSLQSVSAEDWLQWRGPTGDHHAQEGATAPTEWSDDQGLAWKTPIPGEGHSSPTLVGSKIYLTTSDKVAQTQSLLILDRQSGKLLKEVKVHQGGLPGEIHPNNTHASPTVASDGERVFALFLNNNSTMLTAFDLAGNQLWQVEATPFTPQKYSFGFGSSPRLSEGVIVIASEFDGKGSGIVGIDPVTGKHVWKTDRPENLSYSSPAIVPAQGGSQLLISGNNQLAAYQASTGKEIWSVPGSTGATCGTMVWDHSLGLAFASGGYPDHFTCAVKMNGDHEIVWQNRVKCYEQSLLLVDDYLYGMSDNGVVFCWRASDGQQMWKRRLGGPVSASPVLVNGLIYVTNEKGTTFVFKASADGYFEVARNQLGNICFPTSTPADGRLYHRYAVREGENRQEYLAAIGE